MGGQEPRELLAGELASLIGIEDGRGSYRVIASCTASRQKSVVSVLDNRRRPPILSSSYVWSPGSTVTDFLANCLA